MKSNKDKVLKFLSGLMTDEEKKEFETEVNSSPELKLLLEKYSNNISELKMLSETDVDESYFNALIPRMRKKLDVDLNRPLIYRFAPAITALTVTVFILLNILYFDFDTNNNLDDTLASLVAGSDSSTIAELVNEYSYSFLDDYPNDLNLMDDYFSEIELTGELKAEVIDTYNLYENLSEDEVDFIYNSLIDKKIL